MEVNKSVERLIQSCKHVNRGIKRTVEGMDKLAKIRKTKSTMMIKLLDQENTNYFISDKYYQDGKWKIKKLF